MKLVTRIYVAVVASLLLFLVATLLLASVLGGHAHRAYTQEVASKFTADIAPMLNVHLNTLKDFKPPKNFKPPNPTHPHGNTKAHATQPKFANRKQLMQRFRWVRQTKRQLRAFGRQHHANIAIIQADNQLLFHVGKPKHHQPSGFIKKNFTQKNSVSVPLQHGFTAVISTSNPPLSTASFGMRFVIGLGVLFLCVGLIAYPLTRQLTKKLEKLSSAVSNWGKDTQLGSAEKLPIDPSVLAGHDEVSQLAQHFAQASQRISSLLAAHRLLLANASHEIRTPLTRIRLNLEMLDSSIADSKRADFAKREAAIKRNLAELDALVESILQSSRLDAQDTPVNAETFDLYALVKTESEHYENVQITGKNVQIHAQKNLIIQLVRNLLDNAFKHGKPPVSIAITQKHVQHTQQHTQNHTAILSVTNAGESIAADKLNTLFEPFVRLNNQSKGNGLGLSLVKKIVTLHGGEVSVTSSAAATTFTVQLPAGSVCEGK